MSDNERSRLRAWWAHKQGLDGRLRGAGPAEVLAETGWARSVGGSNPYLQLFSRAGTGREEVDAAVASLAIHELPAARGCTYVLPAADYAVGLTVGAAAPWAEVATVAKLGVDRAEIDKLCVAVTEALESAGEPLDPRQLKDVLGDAVRNLGDAGKKKGVTTTLPVALGLLQAEGEIRRVPVGGRLDQQRFAYVRWSASPLTSAGRPSPEQARTELARRYFAWTGGATLGQFRWFSAFSVKDATAAVEPLGLVEIGDGLLALPEDAAALDAFAPPDEPCYALVSWIDGITLLRRDLASLVDPADAERDLGRHLSGSLGGLSDLPAQGIVDRGRLVGLWEYDPAARQVVAACFSPPDEALRAEVARTEEFVRDQLGDVRGSSLDSPKSRAPRIAALRALAG